MKKPASIDPLADRLLAELAKRRESGEIVLGGYVALQHHVDYRTTRDIEAWWRTRADPATEAAIRDAMHRVAGEQGLELKERRFGETLSFELMRARRKRFSFQIAVRSVELEPPLVSAWPPILIEALPDTVGAKMNALVDRGSPRDFLDVWMLVDNRVVTLEQCWQLWAKKNPGASIESAKQKVLLYLENLELRRPLESIRDATQREQAGKVRAWFKSELSS